MANVADVAPVPGQTQAEPPARTSIRGLFAQTEIDLRLSGTAPADRRAGGWLRLGLTWNRVRRQWSATAALLGQGADWNLRR